MTIDLYYSPGSPACITLLLMGEGMGIKFNLKEMDLHVKKDHLKPEFIAINPQHTIPTIVDGDFILWESRAILGYLAEQYGRNDSLYPKNLKIRAEVDRLLHFDQNTLFNRLLNVVSPTMHGQKVEAKSFEKLEEALGWLDKYLDGHFFSVSNRITIADYALVTTVQLMVAIGIDLHKYRSLSSWFTRCTQQMQGFDRLCRTPVDNTIKSLKIKLRM